MSNLAIFTCAHDVNETIVAFFTLPQPRCTCFTISVQVSATLAYFKWLIKLHIRSITGNTSHIFTSTNWNLGCSFVQFGIDCTFLATWQHLFTSLTFTRIIVNKAIVTYTLSIRAYISVCCIANITFSSRRQWCFDFITLLTFIKVIITI